MLNHAHMAEIVDLLRLSKAHRGDAGLHRKKRPATVNPTEDGDEIGKRSADAFRRALGLKPTLDA